MSSKGLSASQKSAIIRLSRLSNGVGPVRHVVGDALARRGYGYWVLRGCNRMRLTSAAHHYARTGEQLL
jgi:hypothetical protein